MDGMGDFLSTLFGNAVKALRKSPALLFGLAVCVVLAAILAYSTTRSVTIMIVVIAAIVVVAVVALAVWLAGTRSRGVVQRIEAGHGARVRADDAQRIARAQNVSQVIKAKRGGTVEARNAQHIDGAASADSDRPGPADG